MNPDDKELTLEESIHEVMRTLPPVIHTYISQGKYTTVAKSLTTKYGLHLDQGSVLEREILLLLMGVENPVEFMDALKNEAHLDQATIENIVQDVNTQIFVPLRKEEEAGAAPSAVSAGQAMLQRPMAVAYVSPRQPAAPVAPIVRPPVVPLPSRPVVGYTPPPEPSTPLGARPIPMPTVPKLVQLGHLENKIPPIPTAPLPPKATLPFAPVKPVLSRYKSFDSSRLLEDHEEPHIEFRQRSAIPTVPVVRSAPSVPVNLPGMMPPMQAEQPIAPPPPAPAPAALSRPAVPAPAAQVRQAPVTSYATDPYREPIDEPLT